MPYLAIVLAVVLIFAAAFGYGMTQADREMAMARADAIRTEADARAFATQMMAMTPMFLIVGSTLVGGLFMVALIRRAGRLAAPVQNYNTFLIAAPTLTALPGPPHYEQLPAPSREFLEALAMPTKLVERGEGYEISNALRQE
jgi:hypothetical protein